MRLENDKSAKESWWFTGRNGWRGTLELLPLHDATQKDYRIASNKKNPNRSVPKMSQTLQLTDAWQQKGWPKDLFFINDKPLTVIAMETILVEHIFGLVQTVKK